MLRMLMYNNTIAPHRDPKRIPKNINTFMPLGKKKVTDAQRKAIENAILNYKNL